MTGLFRTLSILWMGVIFFFSSLKHTDLKQLPDISDILAHGVVYGILGGLLYFSFIHRRGVKAILLSCLYGASDEIHQHFVPGRTPEFKDLFVDTAAALIAVAIIQLFYGITSQTDRRKNAGS